MAYTYFKYPHRYAVHHADPMECQLCHQTKECLEAAAFYAEQELDAICEDCLKAGRLAELQAFTNDADVEQLFEQLEQRFPDKSFDELVILAKEKTDELEQRTPPVVSWQDWKIPAIDGDYGRFVCFASQQDLNQHAPDGNGLAFLERHILDSIREVTNPQALWERIPEKRLKNAAQSNDCPLLVYLFESTVQEGNYVIVWDLM